MNLKQIKPIIIITIFMSLWVIATALAQGPVEQSNQVVDEGAAANDEVTVRQVATTTPNALTQALPIQGQLTDSAGQPINGNRRVTFALYRESTGGTALCEATQPTVAVSAGFFNTIFQLSSSVCNGLKPTEVLNGQKIYLGIKVENDAEMTPRQELYPTSYAIGLAPDADIEGSIDGNSTLYLVNHGREQTVNGVLQNPKALMGWSSPTSGRTYALYGFNSSNEGQGVRGYAGSTVGTTYGVFGQSISPNGRGVYGFASITTTGPAIGVYGVSRSPEGMGVRGFNDSVTGKTYGLYGRSVSPEGVGVYGLADVISGTTYGVFGETPSDTGRGVYGLATAISGTTYGVYGKSQSSLGMGVYGAAEAITGTTYGVYGKSQSDNGMGVYGSAESTTGTTYGVYGKSQSDRGMGIYGAAEAVTGTTYGVFGKSQSNAGTGLYGFANAISGTTYGVYGRSYANKGTGVYGVAEAITGTTYGVYGKSQSANGAAIMGYNGSQGAGVVAQSEQGNPLEAYGSVATQTLFHVTQQGEVYAQGSYHCGQVISETATMISETLTITAVTRNDLTPCLQDHHEADFAEMLPSQGDSLEPGDVLAINEAGELVRSNTAYQSTVMGVYSTRPSYLGSSQLLGQANHVPLALVGIVPVKVSAENGSIKPGDLLTASNTPGHAMRAAPDAPNGTVIGKALGRLETGTGLIRMVVMLQ